MASLSNLRWAWVVLLFLASQSDASPPNSEFWPRLPGAIPGTPDWVEDLPFDAKAFLAAPPDSENAAPLYLKAFYEFDPGMALCFPPEARVRGTEIAEKLQRAQKAYDDFAKDWTRTPGPDVEAVIAENLPGLKLVDRAQARPRCTFSAGRSIDAPLPHLEAARKVSRILLLQGMMHRSRGELDQAIGVFGKILRLSRDVLPGSYPISSIVSTSILYRATEELGMSLIADPNLTAAHCDRLIAELKRHQSESLDPFETAIKGEAVMFRSVIRMLETGKTSRVDEQGRTTDVTLSQLGVAEALLGVVAFDDDPPSDMPMPKAEVLAAVIPPINSRAERDRELADRSVRELLKISTQNFPIRKRTIDSIKAGLKSIRWDQPGNVFVLFLLDRSIFNLSASRHTLYINATLCRIALKKWAIVRRVEPKSLEQACSAAQLSKVPLDPFSGKSLRLAGRGPNLMVYSVGSDGRDDRGQLDADLGRKPSGDFLFPMSKAPSTR